ncbi:hypothetical protein FisN_6Hh415 [Fistulifera solaris]|uniref:Cyclin-like domain-containing protein n=1 Tax=Fistulifera solaris TaxID=1519565 RepID=A0A1Z5K5Q3_FISSO|nr:hypothetical protein FisN_6Hh415 [Fistulifera solaris]|eukprot:GAX21525.1 hypothetical protein FisN_6Hh415 [Fistulifera solaris]
MNPAMIDVDDAIDRLIAMRHQEEVSYSYRKYLPPFPAGSFDGKLNVTWREKICQWSYNVVDHFELSREVVAVSISIFDRFLATQGNKCNGALALLTSLTTLHIAIKLHENKKIKLTTLANLSRGQFGPEHIEEMERRILNAVGWKVHPPTHYSFISDFLLLLPQEANPVVRKELFELSRYISELAVCDSFFVDVNNSTVAFAALLCVMDDISYSRLSAGLREKMLVDISLKVGLNHFSRPVQAARERLRTMFINSSAHTMLASFNQKMYDATSDSHSFGNASISSTGSSSPSLPSRSRTNSFDSKSSYRYSPSPRRHFVASVSPMRHGRSHISCSPIMAGVQ